MNVTLSEKWKTSKSWGHFEGPYLWSLCISSAWRWEQDRPRSLWWDRTECGELCGKSLERPTCKSKTHLSLSWGHPRSQCYWRIAGHLVQIKGSHRATGAGTQADRHCYRWDWVPVLRHCVSTVMLQFIYILLCMQRPYKSLLGNTMWRPKCSLGLIPNSSHC